MGEFCWKLSAEKNAIGFVLKCVDFWAPNDFICILKKRVDETLANRNFQIERDAERNIQGKRVMVIHREAVPLELPDSS